MQPSVFLCRSAMAAAMEQRSSSSQEAATRLAAAQAAAAAAAAPALGHLQAALKAVAAEEREPAAAALAAAMHAAAEQLRGMPPADADLPGCVGALGSAVQQLAEGYSLVAGMLQERHKVRPAGRGASCAIMAAAMPSGGVSSSCCQQHPAIRHL